MKKGKRKLALLCFCNEGKEAKLKDFEKNHVPDQEIHEVYRRFMNRKYVSRCRAKEPCVHCGGTIETYYCEDRLYLVWCRNCKVVAMTLAESPDDAALRSLGRKCAKENKL